MTTPSPKRTDVFLASEVTNLIKHFDEQGYVIVRGVIDDAALTSARVGCEELVEQLATRLFDEGKIEDKCSLVPFESRLYQMCRGCPTSMPNLFRSELHRAEFFPLLCHSSLLDLVSKLMASDVERFRLYPNYSCRPKTKSPLHTVTWHQDAGLRADGGPNTAPLAERTDNFGLDRVINCWAPLTTTTRENGAMLFIPGSHKQGILEHAFVGAYEGSTAKGETLPSKHVDGNVVTKASQAVPAGTYMTSIRTDLLDTALTKGGTIDVECEPGDVVLFNNILIHRGGENNTDKIRWSFDWRFQDAAKKTFRSEQGHVVWSRDVEENSFKGRTAIVTSKEQWEQRVFD
eukprot:m.258303 g.258303  ORF g.258303 m.258303 type:complete len:346 (+) comp36403_c0_seq1:54-1091(+)